MSVSRRTVHKGQTHRSAPTITMQAVVITGFGGTEHLVVREVARPVLREARQVLVRVRAAGLNRADILQRRGYYPAPSGVAADIPGLEFAGEVVETGGDVTEWTTGQHVFGITAGAAQAEYVLTHDDELAAVPDNLSWTEAAAVPEVFITAHDALFTQAHLTVGESLLVHAVGSGVGLAAVQLANHAGATIYGTSRTPDKITAARSYGLTAGITVGTDKEELVAAVKEWTHGAGVNVILDLVGAAYLSANLASLARLGRMLLVGTTAGARAELDFGLMLRQRLTLIGTVLRARTPAEKALATRLFVRDVVPLLASGAVRPTLDRVYPMHEIRAAHERLESNASFGKIVITLD